MCPSREDKRISPSLEATDKRSRALGFSRRLPNSPSNGATVQERAPKVPKLNREQLKQVDLEVKAMLEEGLILKVCNTSRWKVCTV